MRSQRVDTTEQLKYNNNPSDFVMVSGLCSLSLPRRTSVCLDSSFLHSSQKIIYSHKAGIVTVLAWWFFSLLRPSDLHCLLFKVWAQLPHIEDSDVHPMAVYRGRWVGHQLLYHNQKQRILLIFVSKLNPSSNQPFATFVFIRYGGLNVAHKICKNMNKNRTVCQRWRLKVHSFYHLLLTNTLLMLGYAV